MKKRGIIVFLAGVLALAYTAYVFSEIRKSPFGYEFGSAVGPVPLYLRTIGIAGQLATISGLLLTILDFRRWLKSR